MPASSPMQQVAVTLPTDVERWIATEGLRRFDAMKAYPSRGLSSDEVFASLGIEPTGSQ